MEFDSLRVDKSLAVEGVWFPFQEGARMKLARAHVSNPVFREVSRRIRLERGRPPETEEEEREDNIRLYAEAVVRDWDGFTKHGEPCPYSIEEAIRILGDYEDELFPFIYDRTTRRENYRAAETEKAAGN
jgi:hypothetical protein